MSQENSLNIDIPTSASKKSQNNHIVDILGNGQLTKKTILLPICNVQPQKGDWVRIYYSGKLANGVEVEMRKDLAMHVGDFEAVQGLDMVLPLMRVGEVAEVFVDARFAYGEVGLKGETKIPPNANITYLVELLECKTELSEDLRPCDTRLKYGKVKQKRAAFWEKRKEYNKAIHLYSRALEFLEYQNGDSPDVLELRLAVLNNLATAHMQVSAYDAALTAVDNVLECKPSNSEALYLKAKILTAQNDLNKAILCLQAAAGADPLSKPIQKELAKLIIQAKREENDKKEMYQKMLSQANKLEQAAKQRPKSDDTPRLKLLGYIVGSFLCGVFGYVVFNFHSGKFLSRSSKFDGLLRQIHKVMLAKNVAVQML